MSEQQHNAEESSDSLYLKQLTYKPEDGKTFLTFFINNFRVTVLIVIGMLLWGGVSLTQLPQESQPEVKIPYGIIVSTMPGASPSDMEELVVKKIENKVANISGVKQVRSTAANSLAMVTVEFRAEEDIKDAIRRLRDAAQNVKTDLPSDATDPTVTEVSFDNMPVWTIVVNGPYDSFTLRKYAETVQDELKKLPGASEVNLSGGDVYENRISYDPQKLQSYGLTADTVNTIIKANNFGLPSGTIKVSNYEYSVKVDGKLQNVEQLRELPIISVNGQLVRLKDVADVVEKAEERKITNQFSSAGGQPQNAITMNIVKKTGSSIIDLIDSGKSVIEDLKKNRLPKDLSIETTLDQSKTIRKDIEQLVHDGIMTILLVTTILFLFVGLKEAFVAGLAVPLVFAVTFGVMNLVGITINFLSLFSLILSLGLLVDDAIVVVQATKQYLATGKFTPEEAVLLVFHDYKILLTTTTITTIWAFLPLVLATGIIGQFIRSIPITISITLASSYLIAIIINHPMAIVLERFRVTRAIPQAIMGVLAAISAAMVYLTANGQLSGIGSIVGIAIPAILFFALLIWYKNSLKASLLANEEKILEEQADPDKIKAKIYEHYLAPEHEKSWFAKMTGGLIKLDHILPYYGRFLMSILKSRVKQSLILIIVFVLFLGAASLPASGTLKSEFLSPADAEYLYVNIEGAPGLSTAKTKLVTDQVQEMLLKENEIKSFSIIIGNAGVSTSSRLSSSSSGSESNKAQFAINLYPLKDRPASTATGYVEKSYQLAARLRKLVAPIQGAKVEVTEAASGPSSGADFEAQITGDDLLVLEQQANKYKELLKTIAGTINQKTSITLSSGEFSIKLDYDQMQMRGITSAQIAATLRTALSGTDVTKIMKDGDEYNVKSEFKDSDISTVDQLKNMQIANGKGQIFQLSDVATVSLGSSLTSISHIDEKRMVSVTASVEKPHLPTEVLKEFQNKYKQDPLPEGYSIKYGGQNDTNTESIMSILRAMIVAMILIVATLVLQFNSFRKAILILATIPLAVTGVFYGLTAIGFTLSFPALIGIVALFGVVVKNAIILVDKINLNLKVGIAFKESIVDAAKSRLEAIFLTSICTIIGMIPITLTDETWSGLGASLIFGLSTSTFLTLIIVPILFNILVEKPHQKSEKLRKLKEAVEQKKQTTSPLARKVFWGTKQ